jgi:hypothetical protein
MVPCTNGGIYYTKKDSERSEYTAMEARGNIDNQFKSISELKKLLCQLQNRKGSSTNVCF